MNERRPNDPMCYDDIARPPLPPIHGAAVSIEGRGLELTAADGNRFAAYSALAAHGRGGPGMVVMPDVRGLHPFYRELAERFAEAGIHATAMDYFGRTAGTDADTRTNDFDYMPHVRQTEPDSIAADVAATVAYLRSEEGGGADRIFTVGFCFGGRASFNQSARDHGLAGVIGFYGRVGPADDGDTNAPVRLAASYTAPVLGLFGGADQGIPRNVVGDFRAALDTAGVPNEIVIYDGAPHSFFDRTYAEHADACDDAWSRILRFVNQDD
jgi:carboxymethylenebutenolidase